MRDTTYTANFLIDSALTIEILHNRAHKEVLFFASPFFEAALSGNWAETSGGRPQSVSSIITISQPPHVATPDGYNENSLAELTQEIKIGESTDDDSLAAEESGSEVEVEAEEGDLPSEEKEKARQASLQQLQNTGLSIPSSSKGKWKVLDSGSSIRPHSRVQRHAKHTPDAVIVLKEEKVSFLISTRWGTSILIEIRQRHFTIS